MKSYSVIPAVLLIGVMLFSCEPADKKAVLPDPLASHIDSTVNPANDFFDFANGKWFREHPIPASEQSNGIFQVIEDTVNAQVLQICQSAAALTDAPTGSNKQKIGDLPA